MKKRNKKLLLVSIIFLVLAVICLIVGYTIAGVDILAWFSSKYARLFYAVISLWGIIVLSIILGDKIRSI